MATTPDAGLRPLPSHYNHCFGCGREHPTGLHLLMEGGGREVRGSFTVTEHHQGAPMLAVEARAIYVEVALEHFQPGRGFDAPYNP